MTEPGTFLSLLEGQPPKATALLAAERAPLSYGALSDLAQRTLKGLNALGIGRGDRVALVLPNGPEMAAAFLAIGAGAATCPLNPGYREEEFLFYLEDLSAKALILAKGDDSPARAVAERLGLVIFELEASGTAAGDFRLALAQDGGRRNGFAGGGPARAEDTALILHTSGTTARPKIVPLSQHNLLTSARHIAEALALTPADRCLNVMPLFHIHGLIAAVLSSLSVGASAFCSQGFNALRFMSQLEQAKPTWYTAVPTMHQAILARAGRKAPAKPSGLRFIRSASASLPPLVMADLETRFGCPVIEAYGMTEASHQMTSNPLPPGKRKPGTVGLPAGPEVRILSEDGSVTTAPGVLGEIVIRGANVTAGYEANPQANAESFLADGSWFRTGDQGRFDEGGYLFITGRLKEIINRGGEKVSPREVEEVLLHHPAVAQAVTFPLPHGKLGEEVAAAVVLREGSTVDERTLRSFAAQHLADFKVPRRFLFLAEIPNGATGKLQRIGLAQKLGLVGERRPSKGNAT